MRSPARAAVLTVLLLGALSACSDGKVDADSASEPSVETPTDASTDATPEPTTEATADAAAVEEAHALYHALADELDAASQGAADFQTAVKAASEKDPQGFRESSKVARAVEAQQAVVAERDAAVAALGEHPAMADEELAASYQAFAERYAVAMAYQDGFNDSYPAFLATNDDCVAVLGAKEPAVSPLEPAKWARQWQAIERPLARRCLKGAEEIGASTNEDMAKVGGLYERWMADRADLVERFGAGKVSMKAFPKQLKKVNDRFTSAFGRTAAFSETLGELYPTAEYDAVDVVFEDLLGEEDPGSGSPSAVE